MLYRSLTFNTDNHSISFTGQKLCQVKLSICKTLLVLYTIFFTLWFSGFDAEAAPIAEQIVATDLGWGKLSYVVSANGGNILAWKTEKGVYLQTGSETPQRLEGNETDMQLAGSADGAIYRLAAETKGFRLSVSLDEGKNWSSEQSILTQPYHEPVLAAGAHGHVALAWLNQGIYVVQSKDYGRSWSEPSKIGDGEACSCCAPALAFSTSGELYTAYREVAKDGTRDIVLVAGRKGGTAWSKPVKVHNDGWKINSCPSMGPRIRIDKSGIVHVLWWTGEFKLPGIYYAHSVGRKRLKGFTQPLLLSPSRQSPGILNLHYGNDNWLLTSWRVQTGLLFQWESRLSINGGRSFSDRVLKPIPENYQVLAADFNLVRDNLRIAAITADAIAWSNAIQEHKPYPATNLLLLTLKINQEDK